MRKNAGVYFTRIVWRSKLGSARFTSERGTIDQRRAVSATEHEQVIIFDSIALRAAFHGKAIKSEASGT